MEIENLPIRPVLLAVPNMLHHLQLKLSVTGVTLLKDGRYKKRYTGSRTSCVDINGKFYEKSSDLKKILDATREKPRIKKPVDRPRTTGEEIQNTEEPQGNESGDLSTKKVLPRAYRVHKVEVRQRILAMINTIRGKKELYFWTITFPKGTSDQIGYQAYNTWLTALRQKKMLRNYIWVAERQQNGTIHFHMAIPHKMHVHTANRMMASTLVGLAKKNLLPISTFQCKRYNGVDIAKNRKTGRTTNFAIKKGSRSLGYYLTKYVTKNDGWFSHLAWHNSRGFSSLFTGVTMTIAEFKQSGYMDLMLHRSVVDNEFFSYYPWRDEPPDKMVQHLYQVNSYLQEQLN